MLRHTLIALRSCSRKAHTHQDIEHAKKWLIEFQPGEIPRNEFSISYSRSSGPGGQKVNKSSSKATISLEPYQWLNQKVCGWMPKAVIGQIREKPLRYQTKAGGILIQSDTSRNRDVNADECFRKLLQEIKSQVYFEEEASEEDKKKWQKLAAQQKEWRLQEKKRNSERKKSRSKKFDV
ncbi:hypothetical protein OXX80_011318 [Metschnikowia pulcherrima]